MDKKVRRSCRLLVLSQRDDNDLNIVFWLMLHPDILGWIFQLDIANQESIKALCCLKLVCKGWHQAVKVMLKNLEWLAPFTESARVFISESIVLPSKPPGADDFESYMKECYQILKVFLDEMKLHQWYEDVQHDGLVKIKKLLIDKREKKLRLYDVTLNRMLFIVNDAMKIHDLVERIQVQGCEITVLLIGLGFHFNCTNFCKSPTLICCIRNIQKFSLNAGLMNEVMCIIHCFMRISHLCQRSALEAGVIEMVVNILELHFDRAELHLKAHEIFKSVSLINISFLQKARVEKVVFSFMRFSPEILAVQVSCINVLNVLFDQSSSCDIDLYDDLGGFELIRASTRIFSQDAELLYIVLKLFSKVVFLDKQDMCRQIVRDGCIDLCLDYVYTLLLDRDHVHDHNTLYTCVCNTFFAISYDKTLHPALSTARVLSFLQEALTNFTHIKMMSFTVCNMFRLVFYPETELRRNLAPLEIVELVVGCFLGMNLSERYIRDEFMLTIDVLMQSKRSISLVSRTDSPLRVLKAMYLCTHIPVSEYKMIQEALPPGHQKLVLLAGFRIIDRLSSYHSILTLIVQNPDRKMCMSSIATSAMKLHPSDTAVQTAALHMLDKFVGGFPHKHAAFRHDNGLALLKAAMKLPDLNDQVKALAQKTLQLCQLHATRA